MYCLNDCIYCICSFRDDILKHIALLMVKPVIVILDVFVSILMDKDSLLTCSHLLHGMLGNICTECDSYKTRMIEKEVFWVLKIIIYDDHHII